MHPHAHHFVDSHGVRFYVHNGHFYRHHPTFGFELVHRPVNMVLTALPFACVTVTLGGVDYWYGNGVWFAKRVGGYAVIERPVAATNEVYVQVLPVGAVAVALNGVTYYNYNETWFMPTAQGYVIVGSPEDDVMLPDANIVTTLPEGSKRVVVNNRLYWFGADTWFQPVTGGYMIVDEPYK